MVSLAELDHSVRSRIRERSETDFNTDYKASITEEEIKKDTLSFIAEYTLATQKSYYEYLLINGKIKDTDRLEDMSSKMQLSLWERSLHGLPIRREEAELRGILSLEEQLQDASVGDLCIWASPPGPEEENYGDYGFLFIGKVETEEGVRKLKMTAVRLDKSTIREYNDALTSLTSKETTFGTAEEFLTSPVLLKDTSQEQVDEILLNAFGFKEDSVKRARDQEIVRELEESNLLKDFIYTMRHGTNQQKREALNVIVNITIEMKESQEGVSAVKRNLLYDTSLEQLAFEYGHKPPDTKGSCPASTSTSNILNKSSSLDSLLDNEWFVCPKCKYRADGPVGNQCPNCGITKDEYAAESGEVVCE